MLHGNRFAFSNLELVRLETAFNAFLHAPGLVTPPWPKGLRQAARALRQCRPFVICAGPFLAMRIASDRWRGASCASPSDPPPHAPDAARKAARGTLGLANASCRIGHSDPASDLPARLPGP